jgi:hypothetical protein
MKIDLKLLQTCNSHFDTFLILGAFDQSNNPKGYQELWVPAVGN